MSSKKYVPQGVWLVCDKGVTPSQLRSLSYRETIIMGEHMCTRVDKMLVVNFDPFGACACSNGSPCTAPVTDWSNVTDQIRLGGNPLLLENSELPCTLGGRIKIFFTFEAASAAAGISSEEKRSLWSKTLGFGKGLGTGLWKGLKGTVTGVVDLVVWAGKHTTPYMLLNPAGYAEQLQKDGETLKALGNMAGKAGTWLYRNSAVNLLANPQDYLAAQQENKVMLDKLADKAANMSAEEWGDFAGQVLFEVGTEVATAGAAAALTAVKAADKVVDVAKIANRADDVMDAAKALDKADDAIDAAKALDQVKVPKLTNPVNKIIEPAGKKGGWNKILNGELMPNSFYRVDGYVYHTDELGRVVKVEGQLTLNYRGRNTYQQSRSVKLKDGIDGDQGGHLIGDRFNGPGEQINYVPQKGSLNNGAYKKMENEWAEALKEGKDVRVNIENVYEGNSKRPIGQSVNYEINGEKASVDFEN